MSMLAEVRRVPAAELAELVRDSSDIFWHLHGSEPYRPPPSLLARLFKRKAATARRRDPWQAPPDEFRLQLDKAWHCIQFLLSGDPWQGQPWTAERIEHLAVEKSARLLRLLR